MANVSKKEADSSAWNLLCLAWGTSQYYFFIFISCRKDIVLPPPLLCRDITDADMIADAVSNNQLISVLYYNNMHDMCPSDMVVRVRKVLANRGLLRGCVVWPFGPRVRELKGLDLRTEPLRIIFLFIPRAYWTLSVLLSFLQYILSDYRWCGLAVEEPNLSYTLTMDLIISTVCSEGLRNYYLLITKSTNTWYANSFHIVFCILYYNTSSRMAP